MKTVAQDANGRGARPRRTVETHTRDTQESVRIPGAQTVLALITSEVQFELPLLGKVDHMGALKRTGHPAQLLRVP